MSTVSNSTELMACPRCGSEWFVSSRIGKRLAFQMDEQLQPVIIKSVQQVEREAINLRQIFCGACIWHGIPADLVGSMM